MHKITWAVLIVGVVCLLIGCSPGTINEQAAASPSLNPAKAAILESTQPPGLSPEEIATLNSLEQVDKYPLYSMRYQGAYRQGVHTIGNQQVRSRLSGPRPVWGCSLFAAVGDGKDMFYRRNFDWRYSPAVLLFTEPPDGYASVAMVDIDYLLPASLREAAATLTEVPVEERAFLLDAPAWPFDGMNEQGLVVGMAAVMDSRVPYDAAKASIGSLEVIRQMLDRAQNVDEAIDILDRYNIDMDGVPIHYLIADRSGRSVLVEFHDEMVVIPSVFPWQLATNHLRVNVPAGASSGCWRYDRIEQGLSAEGGDLNSQQASDLLQSVSQRGEYPTQWSVVYGIDSGQIRIVMGMNFDDPVYFQFDLIE
jgi:hypothetical protein